MSEKEIDGQTYILKSSVENIVKSRLEKQGIKIAEMQAQIEEYKTTTTNTAELQQKLEAVQTELNNSNLKFTRYQAIAGLGYGQDQELVDAIEWSYKRSQSKLPKKDQTDLQTWLKNCKENPDQAPTVLRPHLKNQNIATEQPQQPQQNNLVELQQPQQPQPQNTPQIISTNAGALPTPDPNSNIIDRGIKDPDFYRQNREAIQNAWRKKARASLRES